MSKRLLASTTLIGVALLLSLTACVDPFGALGAYSDLLPSSEEIRAWQNYDAQVAQAQEEFENGPSVAVRVVNNTPAAARVVLASAMEAPPPPDMDMFYGDVGYPPITVTETVVVAPGGVATGAVKCGDVIAVSALAPLDGVPFYASDYFGVSDMYSYTEPGNVVLTGTGAPPEHAFSGDIVNTVRLVHPATDGLDCTANTLVITIETAAGESVYDPATGTLVSGAAPGSGTISIE